LVIGLFPLALGPQSALLQELCGGLLWLAALLAVLLSLDGLFRSDHEDGSLEQWLLCREPLPLLVLGKVLMHWLCTGFALMLLAPLLALMLGLPGRCLPVLMLSLLLGTPLVLPLYIPLLILGSGAVQADLQGLPASGQLLLRY